MQRNIISCFDTIYVRTSYGLHTDVEKLQGKKSRQVKENGVMFRNINQEIMWSVVAQFKILNSDIVILCLILPVIEGNWSKAGGY